MSVTIEEEPVPYLLDQLIVVAARTYTRFIITQFI